MNFINFLKTSIYKIALIVSISIFILTNILNAFCGIFEYNGDGFSWITYLFCELLYLIIIIWIGQKVENIIKKLILKDKTTIRMVTFFSIYLLINVIFFLLTFPGVWRWDEFYILHEAIYSRLFATQQVWHSVYYIVALQMFVSPTLIALSQILIISAIVSYILTKIDMFIFSKLSNYSNWIYILFIPLILFPIIDSNLYPMRLSILAFLQLLLFFKVIYAKFDDEQLKPKNLFVIAFLIMIIGLTRGENLPLIILVPLIFICMYRKSLHKKYVLFFTSMLVLNGICLYLPQKLSSLNSFPYSYIAICSPMRELIIEAVSQDDEIVVELEEYVDVDGVCNTSNGIEFFWSDNFKDKALTDTSGFTKLYARLILKYPQTFIAERYNMLINSSGFNLNTSIHVNGTFEIDNPDLKDFQGIGVTEGIYNRDLRIAVIEFLEMGTQVDHSDYGFLFTITYNVVPPAIILLGAVIYLFIKKKNGLAFLCLADLCRLGCVILTMPSSYFMYFIPTYILGYFILTSGILKIILNKKLSNKDKESENQTELNSND